MQLAYRMDSDGRNALVYEASVTRLFKQVASHALLSCVVLGCCR